MLNNARALGVMIAVYVGCSGSAGAEANEVTTAAVQCTSDLNYDGRIDTVLLVRNQKGYELLALLGRDFGYQAFLLSTSPAQRHLTCMYGGSVEETSAGTGRRTAKSHKTGGSYIRLEQPEGSAVAYYWRDNGFAEVWLAD